MVCICGGYLVNESGKFTLDEIGNYKCTGRTTTYEWEGNKRKYWRPCDYRYTPTQIKEMYLKQNYKEIENGNKRKQKSAKHSKPVT